MKLLVSDRQAGATVLLILWTDIALLLQMIGTSAAKKESPGRDSAPPDAIERLSRVFGISKVPARVFHRSPPQYMMELYNSITDSGGLTKRQSPYNADVVRSFPDKDSIHRMHFHYNISHYSEEEQVLEAEFHIFKMKPKPSKTSEVKPSHLIEIRVYQVLDLEKIHTNEGLKLLDVRKISAHVHGWQTFRVRKAVESWLNGTEKNYGFLVTTLSKDKKHVNGSYIRFAQRREHHDSKQPILVIFTDDGKPRHPNYISPEDEDYVQIKQDILRRERNQFRSKNFRQQIRLLNERDRAESRILQALGVQQRRAPRIRRSAGNSRKSKGGRKKRTFDGVYRYRQHRRTCARQEMYVDFDEIGWSGWIISPKGYNAYHCSGECPFPLGQSQKPTNHATVQSIVHALRVGKDVGTPCCVPNKLFSISLLYFDDDENVILKQYDDMVAASCGCH